MNNQELLEKKHELIRQLDKSDLSKSEQQRLSEELSKVNEEITTNTLEYLKQTQKSIQKKVSVKKPLLTPKQVRTIFNKKYKQYVVLTQEARSFVDELVEVKKKGRELKVELDKVLSKEKLTAKDEKMLNECLSY